MHTLRHIETERGREARTNRYTRTHTNTNVAMSRHIDIARTNGHICPHCYTHTYAHTHVHAHIHAERLRESDATTNGRRERTHMQTHTHTHAHTHTHTHKHKHTHTHTNKETNTHAHEQTHTHTHKFRYTYSIKKTSRTPHGPMTGTESLINLITLFSMLLSICRYCARIQYMLISHF